jgi:hypothetical protein
MRIPSASFVCLGETNKASTGNAVLLRRGEHLDRNVALMCGQSTWGF